MKIIMISATWCPACLIVHKRLRAMKDVTQRFNFEILDLDFDEDQVAPYQVGKTLPVFVVLDDAGNEIRRVVGERTALELNEEVFHD